MHKHRGFPSRLPGTDYQFTIRRDNPKGATKIIARERYADRNPRDLEADANFLACLWEAFGGEPFVRGNLDAGRISWLFEREVIAAETPFDPQSYESLLKIDIEAARVSFPESIG